MKITKKITSYILACAMCVSITAMPSVSAKADGIGVNLNGEPVIFDVTPQIINDRTMVPVRAIFEALGATVEWDKETKTVTSTKGDTEVSMIINNDFMTVNGKNKSLDSPAVIVDGRTMVPVRAVAESFDTIVRWDKENKTVEIDTVAVRVGDMVTTYREFLNYYSMYLSSGYDEESALNISLSFLQITNAAIAVAKAAGISYTADDLARIKAYLDDFYNNGGKEMLEMTGMREEAITQSIESDIAMEKLFPEKFSEEGMKEYFNEHYYRAKHILLPTIDMETGLPLSALEVKKAKDLASELLNDARKSKNFDALVEKYSKDPGSLAEKDGYYFTDGEMVEEFENTVKSLGIGNCGLCESDYGYHIIKRLALDENEAVYEENFIASEESIRFSIFTEIYKNEIPQMLDEYGLKVELNADLFGSETE